MNWRNWCRLCADFEGSESLIKRESVAFTIEKHFSITLSGPSSYICNECHAFIMKLEEFGERCVKVDFLFRKLLSSNENSLADVEYLKSLRREIGLADKKNSSRSPKTKATCNVFSEDSEFYTLRERKFKEVEGEDPILGELQESENVIVKPEIAIYEDEYCEDVDDSDNDPTFETIVDRDSTSSDDEEFEETVDDDDRLAEEKLDDLKKSKKKSRKTATKSRQKKSITPKSPTEKKITKCPLCESEEFDNRNLYIKHMKEKHPKSEKPFVCSKCPKRYAELNLLKRHEITHLPDDLKFVFGCEHCDKRFSQRVNLKAHIHQVHSGNRPFICEECGKSFPTSGALKEHQVTHSDEHPFQCKQCPKKFKNVACLKRHEDIHSDTQYICPECGLKLNTKITLRRHMVVHSDKTNYKCSYCHKEFKRSKALKLHLITHTGLRPYKCPFCDQTFTNGPNCLKHQKQVHPVECATLKASNCSLPPTVLPKIEHLQPKIPIPGETHS